MEYSNNPWISKDWEPEDDEKLSYAEIWPYWEKEIGSMIRALWKAIEQEPDPKEKLELILIQQDLIGGGLVFSAVDRMVDNIMKGRPYLPRNYNELLSDKQTHYEDLEDYYRKTELKPIDPETLEKFLNGELEE